MDSKKKLFIVVVSLRKSGWNMSKQLLELLEIFDGRAEVYKVDPAIYWAVFADGRSPDFIFLSQDQVYILDAIRSSLSAGTNSEKTKIVIVKNDLTTDVKLCDEKPQLFYVGGLVGSEMLANLFGQIEGFKEAANFFHKLSGGIS